MATIAYTARRRLVSGHTVGTSYNIVIDMQQQNGGTPQHVGRMNESIDGSVVGVLHHLKYVWQVTTDLVPATGGTPSDADFDEFFSSVANGEQFIFDEGSLQRAVRLDGAPTRTRQGIFYQYSFRMVEF